MRIAFLDSWAQTQIDGITSSEALGSFYEALRRRGHHVAQISPWAERPGPLMLRRLLFNLTLPPLLDMLAYDLVVGFGIDGFFWSRHTHRSPYVCGVRGVLAEGVLAEAGTTRMSLRVLARLERENVRHADLVLADSAFSRAAIGRHYGVPGRRVRLLHTGIDLERWQINGSGLPRQSDGATILCVSRQTPRRRIADLLHALVIVRQQVPEAHAVIVGDGPDHQHLRDLAESLGLAGATHFVAERNDAVVAELYRTADIFCLPSLHEGVGRVFIEAMACGLPIVATLSTSIPEIVPRSRAGLLVPPANPQSLARALVALLENPEQRAAFGAYGQQHAQEYRWDRVAEQFLAAVAPLVAAERGTPYPLAYPSQPTG